MGLAAKIAIGFVAGTLLFGGVGTCALVGAKNTMVRNERGIVAQYEQDQNNLANYTNKIMEMAQVPAMAEKQIANVARAAIQGRYGDGGSKAVFQAVAEQNPNMPAGIYTNIQQAIEAGRDSFAADQKMRIDKCRAYESYYMAFPWSMVAAAFNHPTIDMTKLCKPVVTEGTAKAFETKRSGPIEIAH